MLFTTLKTGSSCNILLFSVKKEHMEIRVAQNVYFTSHPLSFHMTVILALLSGRVHAAAAAAGDRLPPGARADAALLAV